MAGLKQQRNFLRYSVDFLKKLEKFYWSPKRPEAYVIEHNGEQIGYGRVAHKCYGTFNILWATCPLATRDDHIAAVIAAGDLRKRLQQVVDGAPLADHITLFTPTELRAWLGEHRKAVHKGTLREIDAALAALLDFEKV